MTRTLAIVAAIMTVSGASTLAYPGATLAAAKVKSHSNTNNNRVSSPAPPGPYRLDAKGYCRDAKGAVAAKGICAAKP